uniref:Longin domain-containing protein n=1 Tax=Picea sitchensis TaxID=3332 RepID=D5ACM3_PICSI|nr:unknown [Picea sitchensis]
MVKLTMIARVTDGLPLAEGLDDGREQRDVEFYKQQAKSLFKKLSQGQNEPSRMSIESGPYVFHSHFSTWRISRMSLRRGTTLKLKLWQGPMLSLNLIHLFKRQGSCT